MIRGSSNRLSLPGIDINFEMQSQQQDGVALRGTVILPLALDWGAEDTLIKLTRRDMRSTRSLELVGFTGFDDESTLLSLVFAGAHTVIIYRLNSGGARAVVSRDGITFRARHTGIFGNRLSVSLQETSPGMYVLNTFVDGTRLVSQRVNSIQDLRSNEYIEVFTAEDAELVSIANEPLTGGTNGSYGAPSYAEFLSLAESATFDIITIPEANATVQNTLVSTMVKWADNPEEYNIFAQAVVFDLPDLDHFSLINYGGQALTFSSIEFTPIESMLWVAGAAAGAPVGADLVHYQVQGATDVYPSYNSEEKEALVNTGRFLFTKTDISRVVVVLDINSDQGRTGLERNRVVRAKNSYIKTCRNIWFDNFIGTSNTEARQIAFTNARFMAAITLQGEGALQDVDISQFSTTFGERLGPNGETVPDRSAVQATDYLIFTGAMERLQIDIRGEL